MEQKIPQHVAIIMDGNGRWAESKGLPRIEGHKAGVESVKKIIRCCMTKGIPCLSLFAFSSENWSRPAEEVNFLMELFLESLRKELAELNQHGIRLRFTGDRGLLSAVLQQQMREAERVTENNEQLILNVVVNYGGKWDVVSAAKKVARAVQNGELAIDDITETSFAHYLDTERLPDPDLFIRTSGELRISNFFLWQLAYTELYFCEVHWPDFGEHELEMALASFNKRKRRFGQISELI
ncbi:isoprenyl transferase [Fluoribacter dumoffii]|uniref:Ditrans,polycis-undecaprenyl-diphosphate synthase ((2E,6E)-farnesyl-diphosphate specific) n=1 Tax=Fluoribacter dumoffii TaxID=463 RepID=A0A377GCU0_9GAMM|nr:isoprenyl transferase [Fluoribacter dumoffii]KTC90941.1 UDP pyrophosphate synthetase [Fluoribacter dumoffii NY 23]MCW8386510.1 isoprenyl transferase [Fluoribacter dumoffii]MCW8419564.1 isoprenyl transferase [Fluoribacter dumoffii]MCW8455733.1 isoprenyl transferase [Fluoribacter dumoffii]MCW8460188.1 isoprenyl transferase [Fluoribacter dumoffii]